MLDPSGGAPGHDRWKQFGFLIADLFLVLALLFLLMTISAQHEVQQLKAELAQTTPTPTVTPRPLTPTPLPRLDTSPVTLTLKVDASALLAGSSSAKTTILDAIKGNSHLKGRRAGLVIAYGGTPDQSGTGRAVQVAGKVDDVLQTLGGHGQTFEGTTYHDPLFTLRQSYNYVRLEVYLFKIT